jgi:GntR family transcriptional repressor for pyruvate dehydrogenase complex
MKGDRMFKKAKSSKLYEDVIIQIKTLIESNELKTGQLLPSEEELSKNIGVGRSSIREGLRVLEILGYVETIRGKGTFVVYKNNEKVKSDISDILDEFKGKMHEINELNAMLISSTAKRVSQIATPKDLKKIENTITISQKRLENGEYNEDDLSNFSNILASILDNSLLTHILSDIHKLDKFNRKLIVSTPDRPYKNQIEFNNVYLAIKNKNSVEAFTNMEIHFQNIRQILDNNK